MVPFKGSSETHPSPRGCIYTTIMEQGPKNHFRDGLLGPKFHNGSVHGPFGQGLGLRVCLGYRGLNKYQYSFFYGGSLFYLSYNGPQHPILIVKAPISSLCEASFFVTSGPKYILDGLWAVSSDMNSLSPSPKAGNPNLQNRKL